MPTTFGPNQRERHAPRTAGMRAAPRARAPAFGPRTEVIARANREAERKKEPAAAFWGNELIWEFAMKPMSQSRRTGPCRQTDDAWRNKANPSAWRNKANAIPGQQLASGATAGGSGAEFDPKLTPRYREATTHGILTKR